MLLQNSLGLTDTGAAVKTYFAVGVYRNVLDMLMTFEGQLNSWRDQLYNDAIMFNARTRQKLYMGANRDALGYAISIVGKQKNPAYFLLYKTLKDNGFNPPAYLQDVNNLSISPESIVSKYGSSQYGANVKKLTTKFNAFVVPSTKPTRPNSVRDLLTLGRQLNWELNRIRLPTPHNFRQVVDKIQGTSSRFITYNLIDNDGYALKVTMDSRAYIRLIDSLSLTTQLKTTVAALRTSIRKEIDAANLAAKVQEETIRAEAAALITRREAAALAEAERIRILEEKKKSYELELAEAEKLRIALAETREQLALELINIQGVQTVANSDEIADLKKQENDVLNAIDKVDQTVNGADNRSQKLIDASLNLNGQIREITDTNIDGDFMIKGPNRAQLTGDKKTDLPIKKKSKLTPILITIAAGVLLS